MTHLRGESATLIQHTGSRALLTIVAASALAVAALTIAPSASAAPSTKPTCTITGTSGDDFLVGTGGADVICGLGGDDELRGRAGDDVLIGGPGDDRLAGGPGDDDLVGGPGYDKVGYDPYESFTMGVKFFNRSDVPLVLRYSQGSDCTEHLLSQPFTVTPGEHPYQATFYVDRGVTDGCMHHSASVHYQVSLENGRDMGDIWLVATNTGAQEFKGTCYGAMRDCGWLQRPREGNLTFG